MNNNPNPPNNRKEKKMNAIIKTLLATVLIALAGTMPAVAGDAPALPATGATNLALGKGAFASSSEGQNYFPTRATDGKEGKEGTRWASTIGAPQWIYVDLFSVCTVDRVVLKWEAAYAKSYAIQVSNDAQNWRDVYTTTSSKGGREDIAIPPTKTHYLRVHVTEHGPRYNCCSLWELEVYGVEGPAPDFPPVRIRPEPLRTTASLGGTWHCAVVRGDAADELPRRWVQSIPVPGMTDMAAIGVYKIDYDYVFHRRRFTIEGPIPTVALLKISQAFYGKKVWLNGKVLGEHHPNFTPAYFDLKPALLGDGQVNELVIRLGIRGSQSAGFCTGYDKEKKSYYPALYDDVSLILSGAAHIDQVRHRPDIDKSLVKVAARVKNHASQAVEVPVKAEISEAVSGRPAGSASGTVKLGAGQSGEVELSVPIASPHLWTPDDPFLYKLAVSTPSDQFSTRIGMREFVLDKAIGKMRLNGKPFVLRGTNFAFLRFSEDPEREGLLWDKEFARRVIRKHKSINMNSARSHISFPPEVWYEVCDEEGFVLQNEYPCWPVEPGITADSWTPEVLDWIAERQNHACIAIWDLSNESSGGVLSDVVARVRHADLQGRPWQYDARGSDFAEIHPYLTVDYTKEKWRMDLLEKRIDKLADGLVHGRNTLINEYDWLWLNRDGRPAGLAEKFYGTGWTERQRRDFFGKTTAMLTEMHRAGGAASVQQFVGLTCCGRWATADNFVGKLTDLKFDPLFEKMMRDAMAPVMVMIQTFKQEHPAGTKATLPVLVVNDSDGPWSGTVTLRFKQGARTVWQHEAAVRDLEIGYRKQLKFDVTWPAETGEYELVAQYVEKNVPVQSVREITIK